MLLPLLLTSMLPSAANKFGIGAYKVDKAQPPLTTQLPWARDLVGT